MKTKITERQLEIIEASGRLLMNKGVKGLTTKNLALEMGFSESALYRHFKNKEDIIALLLRHFAETISERLNTIIDEEKTSEANLKAVFKSQFAFLKQHPHFVIAILSEGLFDESEKINNAIMKVFEIKMGILRQLIEIGKKNKEFKKDLPTDDLLHIMAGSFRLMILKWKFSNFKSDLEMEGYNCIDTLIGLIKESKNESKYS